MTWPISQNSFELNLYGLVLHKWSILLLWSQKLVLRLKTLNLIVFMIFMILICTRARTSLDLAFFACSRQIYKSGLTFCLAVSEQSLMGQSCQSLPSSLVRCSRYTQYNSLFFFSNIFYSFFVPVIETYLGSYVPLNFPSLCLFICVSFLPLCVYLFAHFTYCFVPVFAIVTHILPRIRHFWQVVKKWNFKWIALSETSLKF